MSNIGSLHVRGRRTGVMRIVRLRYAITSDGSVLISAGGLTEQWPLNLRANPACRFEMGGEVRHYPCHRAIRPALPSRPGVSWFQDFTPHTTEPWRSGRTE